MVGYGPFQGLNTRKLPHMLSRAQLAASVNLWSDYDGGLSKRPGSVAFTGFGPTGAGVPGSGLVSARFGGITYLVALQVIAGVPTLKYAAAGSGAWTTLGTLSAGVTAISAAQMYDPETGFDTLFIVDGVDIPQTWKGPGTGLVPVKTGIQNGTDVITLNPALVGGGNLIAAVAPAGAAKTTVFTVTVDAAGATASVVDSEFFGITIASGGTGVLDGVSVTIGVLAAGDAGKVGTITINQAHAYLPNNGTNTAPITPKYVATLGNNSHLFYSGEPTAPSAVYISNPFFPQRFENNAQQVSPYNGKYLPAIIGLNDGVEGGAIVGMGGLQGAMIIVKESAVYKMVMQVLLGEVPIWQVIQISSRGSTSPRSIVFFEINGTTFFTYLSIDGIYLNDGNASKKLTGGVPTFFDATRQGGQCLITDRTTAIGGRHGNKLLLSFAISAIGYNEGGLWVDFDNQDEDGLPLCGQIADFTPAGMVALDGPHDDGNMAWIDATQDMVGKFGVGYSDIITDGAGHAAGKPISVTIAGKADLFEDLFGPDSRGRRKVAKKLWLYVSMPSQNALEGVAFQPVIITDQLAQIAPGQVVPPVYAPPQGAWDIGQWGSMVWSGGGAEYVAIPIALQASTRGRMLQVVVQESSQVPWTILGYALEMNDQLLDV